MRRYIFTTVFFMAFCLLCPWSVSAEVEWQIEQTIKLGRKPVDMAVSARGTYLFALTDDGILHVYDSGGNIKGDFNVGKHIDGIAC